MVVALSCAKMLRPHRDILEMKRGLEADPKFGCHLNEIPPSRDYFNEYFKFGFVRNPWDRVVSLYKRLEGMSMSRLMKFEEFVEWIEYSSDASIHPTQHKNQLDWFTDDNGSVIVDFIGKFENLDSGWRKVCKKLSVDIVLPHLVRNSLKTGNYTENYTTKTRVLLEKNFVWILNILTTNLINNRCYFYLYLITMMNKTGKLWSGYLIITFSKYLIVIIFR